MPAQGNKFGNLMYDIECTCLTATKSCLDKAMTHTSLSITIHYCARLTHYCCMCHEVRTAMPPRRRVGANAFAREHQLLAPPIGHCLALSLQLATAVRRLCG